MSIIKRISQTFGLVKAPQEYNIHIYSKNKSQSEGLSKELKKHCKKESHILHSEEELFSLNPNKNDILILIFPAKDRLGYKANIPIIINAKKLFKHIISLDIQYLLEETISAGSEYAISLEHGTFTTSKGRIIYNLGNTFVSLNIDLLNTAIDKTQHRSLLHQDQKGLLEEKAQFYNSVKDIFLERAQKTAHTNDEISFIAKQANRFDAKTIFDGGCGSGRLSIALAENGFFVLGMDISEELLHKAPHHKNITYLRGNLLETHQKSKSFDLAILMWHVICDLKDKRKELIREMNRIIKHDGILLFDFPDKMHNKAITKEGIYSDETPFGKYVSLVPELKEIFIELQLLGFSTIEYKKVKWGINKFVIIARKSGLSW